MWWTLNRIFIRFIRFWKFGSFGLSWLGLLITASYSVCLDKILIYLWYNYIWWTNFSWQHLNQQSKSRLIPPETGLGGSLLNTPRSANEPEIKPISSFSSSRGARRCTGWRCRLTVRRSWVLDQCSVCECFHQELQLPPTVQRPACQVDCRW